MLLNLKLIWHMKFLVLFILCIATSITVNLYFAEDFAISLVSWLCSIVVLLIFIYQTNTDLNRSCTSHALLTRNDLILIFSIVGIAIFLRTWNLYWDPIFLWNDAMNMGLEARKFLISPPPLFHTGWATQPNLTFVWISGFFLLFGPTLESLRFCSVSFGILSLVATYLLACEMFTKRLAATILVLASVSHWHLWYSRFGVTNLQATAFQTLGFYFLFRGNRRVDMLSFAFSGIFLGLSIQSYSAAVLGPIIILAWVIWMSLFGKDKTLSFRGLLVTAFFTVVTIAPLLTNYFRREGFFGKAMGVSIFKPENLKHAQSIVGSENIIPILFYQMKATILPFVWQPYPFFTEYGFSGTMIDPILIWAVLPGFLYSICKLRESSWSFLTIWILSTLISGGILTIDAPSLRRLTPISTVWVIYPSIILYLASDWIKTHQWSRTKWLASCPIYLAWFYAAYWNLNGFFLNRNLAADHRMDIIVRMLDLNKQITFVLNTAQGDEVFGAQEYKFMSPGVIGINLDSSTVKLDEIKTRICSIVGNALVLIVSPLDGAPSYLKDLPLLLTKDTPFRYPKKTTIEFSYSIGSVDLRKCQQTTDLRDPIT